MDFWEIECFSFDLRLENEKMSCIGDNRAVTQTYMLNSILHEKCFVGSIFEETLFWYEV